MSRQIISIFFSMLFLAFLAAPSVIVLVDDSIDVSMFYASSEEEEKGSEKNKDIEVLFTDGIGNELVFNSKQTSNNLGYFFKNYPKPQLNLISPPPQQIIL